MNQMNYPYYPIGMSCTHCGGELSAAYRPSGSISIKGLRSLSYIHTETGQKECWRKGEASPYDGWQATAAFEKARQESLTYEDT